MATTQNIGRNQIKESDLPFHLRASRGKGGNNQLISIFNPNPSNSSNQFIEYTAGENGSKYDIMMLKTDGLAWKGKAESIYANRIIGVAVENYSVGNPFKIQTFGIVENNSLSLDTTKYIYLRNNGVASQTQLVAIASPEDTDIIIGVPLTATSYQLLTPFRYVIIY